MTSVDVGHISARLDAVFEQAGFAAFDRAYDKAQLEAAKRVTAKLDADYDSRGVDAYTAALLRARGQASRREDFKAKLGADFDESAFRAWDREVTQARRGAARPIDAKLGADFDPRAVKAYNDELDRVEKRTRRRDLFQARLGGDFDENAFKAFERTLQDVTDAGRDAEGVFGGGGGGGGLSAGFGSLRGAIGPVAAVAAAAAPLLVALAGAATALAASLAAAIAGAGALGVGLVAALGPIAAIAAAVVQRAGVIQEAYKAIGTQQTKSAAQSTAAADQQRAAADRVKQARLGLADAERQVLRAQENLTEAERRGRRELDDLRIAAERAGLAQQHAGLALDQALKQLAETEADPHATRLELRDAQLGVRDAREGLKQTRIERDRANADAKRGTDTVKRAHEQLADARRGAARASDQVTAAEHAATSATDKHGAAATDAQEKLAKLSATERHLLTTVRRTVDALRDTFKPATDAIFGSVDRALERLTPSVARLRKPLGEIGDAIGGVIDRLSKSLAGDAWRSAFSTFADTATKLVKPIGDAFGSIGDIFRDIAVAAQPLVLEFVRAFARFLGDIAGKTKDTDRMRGIIRDLVGHTKDWLRFLGAVGTLLFRVFNGGARDGHSLLNSLTRIVEKWSDFLGTDKGQREMRQFFHDSVQVTKDLGRVIGLLLAPVAKAIGLIITLAGAFGRFRESDNPAVKVLRTVLDFALKTALPFRTLILYADRLPGVFTTVFNKVADVLLGFETTWLNVAEKIADVGSHIPGIGGKFKGLRDAIHEARDGIDKYRESLRRTGDEHDRIDMSKVRRENRDTARSFRDLGRDGKASITDVRKTVEDNTERIKKHLGSDTAEGKEAAARNFREAAAAIERQMRRGEIATKDGLKAIRGYLSDELQVYGLSLRQARNIVATGDPDANRGREGGATRARGGWIGQPGAVGHDSIALDAPVGGSILNRHQLPFADLALHADGLGGIAGLLARGGRARGGPTTRVVVAPGELHLDPGQTGALDRALAGMGGLDGLFASVRTPHFMARGGQIVSVPGFPGERAAREILDEIAWVHRKYGLTLTDAYGPGHKSPGHTIYGTAADFAGPDRSMDAAVRELVRRGYTVGYDGRFGSKRWPGHGPSTVAGANAHLHVEFGGPGQISGLDALPTLPSARIRGGGDVGRIAQRALGMARRGASRLLGGAGAGVGDAPGHGGGPRAHAGQIRSWLAAGLRLAGVPATAANVSTLQPRVMQESGGDPRAINLWDSNARAGHPSKGFLQTIDSTFRRYMVRGHGNIWNPVDNTAAAVRYMLATYGHLVGRSGSGYAFGGRIGQAVGKVSALVSNRGVGALNQRQKGRSTAYDRIMGDDGIVDRLERKYTLTERRYNLSQEEFVNPDTGALDQAAIQRGTQELFGLGLIRGQIIEQLLAARKIKERIVRSYRTILARLRASLRFAPGKDRGHVKANITAYGDDLTQAEKELYGLGETIQGAQLDRAQLDQEYAAIVGTKPRPPDAPAADTSAAAGAPSAEDIARGVLEKLDAYQGQTRDLFAQFGSNFRTGYSDQRPSMETPRLYGAEGSAVGFEGGAPGAAGAAGGGHTVNNYFAAPAGVRAAGALGDACHESRSPSPSSTAPATPSRAPASSHAGAPTTRWRRGTPRRLAAADRPPRWPPTPRAA
jgi:hypothetical protein